MKLRIHGDNIIECERALKLIEQAYKATVSDKTEDIYMPAYSLKVDNKELFEVELLSGHNRWGVNFNTELTKYGANLREATDAYISKVSSDGTTEELLLAMEFCSALPAGNNAWQRSGRAITCAEIGLPYFYFAEIGGVELNADRQVKAARFPTPVVPFSYLTASKSLNVICIPIYQAHPAISVSLRSQFKDIFGYDTSLELLKAILEGDNIDDAMNILVKKGISLVNILSGDRKSVDTFRTTQWEEFMNLASGLGKADWIKNDPNRQIWKKKILEKVKVTETFKRLVAAIQNINCLSIGAKGIPICLIDKDNIINFTKILKSIYPADRINGLTSAIENKGEPLILVWITGFKPGGDDSRPDRGLVPLARMLFGNDIDILSIVSGPAPEITWKTLEHEPQKLAKGNGLWEAVINLSNYVISDSTTTKESVVASILQRDLKRVKQKIFYKASNLNEVYSEHDVDTAIHTLFSRQLESNIFESMCNPPGGDWSGISFLDFKDHTEYRWTSLPRVSQIRAKRPDHIIQINMPSEEIFLVIESKTRAKDLDDNIGKRLVEYVDVLFKIPPTAHKSKNSDWHSYLGQKSPLTNISTYSGGAFCYTGVIEMGESMIKGDLDFVLAFEFSNHGKASVGHLLTSNKGKFLNDIFTKISAQFNGRFEIKIY